MPADFELCNYGNVYTLIPLTEVAEIWCFDHLPDDCPMIGNAYAIEHRHVEDIIDDFSEEGLTYE